MFIFPCTKLHQPRRDKILIPHCWSSAHQPRFASWPHLRILRIYQPCRIIIIIIITIIIINIKLTWPQPSPKLTSPMRTCWPLLSTVRGPPESPWQPSLLSCPPAHNIWSVIPLPIAAVHTELDTTGTSTSIKLSADAPPNEVVPHPGIF